MGSLGRYGLAVAVPTAPGTFPLATFLTNVAGCLLIGALVVGIFTVNTAGSLALGLEVGAALGGS